MLFVCFSFPEANDDNNQCLLCDSSDNKTLPVEPNHKETEHALNCSKSQICDIIRRQEPCHPAQSFYLLSPNNVNQEITNSNGSNNDSSHKNGSNQKQGISQKEKRQLKRACDKSHERVYTCFKCGMPFKSVRLYLMHYQLHQQEEKNAGSADNFRCTTCKRSFTSKETLEKHKQLHSNSSYQFRNGFTSIGLREIIHRSKKNFVKQLPLSVRRGPVASLNVPITQQGEKELADPIKTLTNVLPAKTDSQIIAKKIHVDYSSFAAVSDVATSKNNSEFSPEVLKDARKYIKEVSRRRKEDTIKRITQNKSDKDPVLHSSHTIGVDVELERSEESMPIVGMEGDRYYYQCKKCSKRFYNKFHHREHYNIHSGETPYECEFCSKRFAQRSGWNRHIKLHHKYSVFKGPIPYSHMTNQEISGGDVTQPNHKRPKIDSVSSATKSTFQPTMTQFNPAAFHVNAQGTATRFIPIAPYPRPMLPASSGNASFPAGGIPLSPAILSPDRFPNSLDNALPAGAFLIQAPHGNTHQVVSPHQGSTIQFLQPNKPPISAVFVQPNTNMQSQHQQPQHSQQQASLQQQQKQPDKIPTVCVSNPISLIGVKLAELPARANSPTPQQQSGGAVNPSNQQQQKISNTTNTTSATTSQSDQQPRIEKVRFQCKKVKTMEDRVIFMVRVIEEHKKEPEKPPEEEEGLDVKQEPKEETSEETTVDKPEVVEKKSEFAYVLDPVGKVESRIFVSDHQGGNWTDFPLDEVANSIMLSRIRAYDEMNKRGPKPKHFTNLFDDAIQTGKEKLEEALVKQNKVVEARGDDNEDCFGNMAVNVDADNTAAVTLPCDLSKQPLITHGRNFRSGREKRFSCTVCSRKFLAQAHLNDHMLIHTGEFPFKCMFCSRPFRHKSGLNSHHKRHIQNGVFDRPISCKDPAKLLKKKQQRLQQVMREQQQKVNIQQKQPMVSADSMKQALGLTVDGGQVPNQQQQQYFLFQHQQQRNQQSQLQNSTGSSTTKSKRKGRPPRRKEASLPQPPVQSPLLLYKVKEEETDESDGNPGYILPNKNRETVTFDVQDVFECNFCGLTFPMRTAYLKHVSTVHRNPVTSLSDVTNNTSSLLNSDNVSAKTAAGVGALMMDSADSEGSDSTHYIDKHHQMSEFENTLLDIASPPISPPGRGGNNSNDHDEIGVSVGKQPFEGGSVVAMGDEGGLIPAHQIKEELPDY